MQLSSTLRVTRVSIGSLSLMHDLATCGFAASAVFELGFRGYRDIKLSSDRICRIAGLESPINKVTSRLATGFKMQSRLLLATRIEK